MGTIASQMTSLTIVYSTVYSGANQRKHQRSASLAFVRGIHRWLVNIRNLINVAFQGRTTKYMNQDIRQVKVYNRKSSHSFIHAVIFYSFIYLSFCQLFPIPSIGKTTHNAKTPLALRRFDELHSKMFWGDYFKIKDKNHCYSAMLLYDD